MDPITTAIVAMASAGLTAIGQDACADAYQALKAVINRKLGQSLPKMRRGQTLINDLTSSA